MVLQFSHYNHMYRTPEIQSDGQNPAGKSVDRMASGSIVSRSDHILVLRTY
jgi:hypothetical protein